MRRHVFTLAMTAAVLSATSIAFAVPGELDTTFGGGDGKVTTDFDADLTLYDAARDVAAAPGGKIVAVGVGRTPNYDFAIARYLPNGDLDTSFGGDGQVTTDFFGQPDWAHAVEVLRDGKVLVVGGARSADNSDELFAVARYRPNGTLDSSFGGGDGKVTTNFSLAAAAYGVAVQREGSFVAVGEVYGGSPVADMAIVRYRAAGRLDREFGRRGKRTIDFAGREDGAEAVAFQDGKILVGGWGEQASGPSDNDVALARLHPDGALDRTFGRRGKRLLGNLNGNQWVEGLSVLRSGRFVIAFYADEDFALARFRADGRLDDDFGAGGFAIRNFGGAEYTKDLVRAGNRLYVTGVAGDDFAVAAFGASGRLLSGFGTGGLAVADFGGSDWANAATLVSGKLVLAGLADNQHFGLARFLVQ